MHLDPYSAKTDPKKLFLDHCSHHKIYKLMRILTHLPIIIFWLPMKIGTLLLITGENIILFINALLGGRPFFRQTIYLAIHVTALAIHVSLRALMSVGALINGIFSTLTLALQGLGLLCAKTLLYNASESSKCIIDWHIAAFKGSAYKVLGMFGRALAEASAVLTDIAQTIPAACGVALLWLTLEVVLKLYIINDIINGSSSPYFISLPVFARMRASVEFYYNNKASRYPSHNHIVKFKVDAKTKEITENTYPEIDFKGLADIKESQHQTLNDSLQIDYYIHTVPFYRSIFYTISTFIKDKLKSVRKNKAEDSNVPQSQTPRNQREKAIRKEIEKAVAANNYKAAHGKETSRIIVIPGEHINIRYKYLNIWLDMDEELSDKQITLLQEEIRIVFKTVNEKYQQYYNDNIYEAKYYVLNKTLPSCMTPLPEERAQDLNEEPGTNFETIRIIAAMCLTHFKNHDAAKC